MTSSRVIEIIRDKLDFPWRYPPLPVIDADTELAERWFGPVDRATVQMALDEEFGIEIPCLEMASAQSVQDIIDIVGLRARVEV